jgi:hypothetical protein
LPRESRICLAWTASMEAKGKTPAWVGLHVRFGA